MSSTSRCIWAARSACVAQPVDKRISKKRKYRCMETSSQNWTFAQQQRHPSRVNSSQRRGLAMFDKSSNDCDGERHHGMKSNDGITMQIFLFTVVTSHRRGASLSRY